MGRPCKCRVCGKKLNTDEAFRVYQSGHNAYYCTKTEYKDDLTKKALRREINDIVYRTIGEDYLAKRSWTEINATVELMLEKYQLNEIRDFLLELEDYAYKTLNNKSFDNDFGKTRYYTAILKARMKDIRKEPEKQAVHIQTETYNKPSKYKPKPRRKTMIEYENEEDQDEWDS